MPGPADNHPWYQLIEAAVNPSKTDYLYFVANVENAPSAKTYEEHNKIKQNISYKLDTSSPTRKAQVSPQL